MPITTEYKIATGIAEAFNLTPADFETGHLTAEQMRTLAAILQKAVDRGDCEPEEWRQYLIRKAGYILANKVRMN